MVGWLDVFFVGLVVGFGVLLVGCGVYVCFCSDGVFFCFRSLRGCWCGFILVQFGAGNLLKPVWALGLFCCFDVQGCLWSSVRCVGRFSHPSKATEISQSSRQQSLQHQTASILQDIWALGCLAGEVLLGTLPHEAVQLC